MFFRNLVILTFPVNFPGLIASPVADELSDLRERLDEARLKPVGPLERVSVGFISPFGRDEEQLVHEMQDQRWISVGSEERILPPAVIDDLLRKKLREIEEREGRKVGGVTRKRLKGDLIHELLPQAFVKPGRTDAYLDLGRGLICVDTSSRKRADQVVCEMRRALGSFPAMPLNAEVAPRSVLTGWLAGEPMPDGFSLGDECELRDAMENGAVVTLRNSELNADEVQKHLEAGLQCTQLALVYQDHVSLVLDEDLTVRKLRFLDGAVDELENTEHDDIRAELDARFALMTGELGPLLDELFRAFKVTRPGAAERDSAAPAPKPTRKRKGSTDGTVTISAVGPDGKETHLATFTETQFKQAPAAASARGGLTERARSGVGEDDPLYDAAAAHVRKVGRVSISNLQCALKTGYNRAAHLVEALEHRRVVSPPDHRGDRKVL
jgi:recombination associated protein RdgC